MRPIKRVKSENLVKRWPNRKCQISAHGPFWLLPSMFLTGAAAAGGIALTNALAASSGFAGPYAVGLLTGASGDFRNGLWLLAFVPLAGMALALRLRHATVLRDAR
jgi:ACS family tartrate transporter-like MFS transporter